jgi:hypothetical protein
MKRGLIFPFLLAFAMLILPAIACRFNFDQREEMTTRLKRYYSIEPLSLLDALEKENASPFTPIATEPELPPLSEQIPVNWHQEDYLNIVQALFKEVWGDTPEGWSLKSFGFSVACSFVDYGFQDGSFRYFKNAEKANEQIRVERRIYIDARSGFVQVSEFEYAPRLVDWGVVDMTRLHYSADDVLQIAEKEGGREARLAIQNNCDVNLLLVSDAPRYRGWDIWYWGYRGYDGNIFEIWVDPVTGKIRR